MARTRRRYPEEGTMAVTLEERVEVLEGKVENLETNAGPGRVDAHSGNLADLRRQFAGFGEVQAKHSQTLDMHTGKFSGLERSMIELRFDVGVLKTGLKEFKEEVAGKLERLDNDVSALRRDLTGQDGVLIGLSADVIALRTDVTELRTDVTELRTDVTALRTDVTELRTDVTELRTDVTKLQDDVTGLRTDVTKLQDDFTEFKVEVRGTLKEILERLPAKAA
jgi:chromosome segregation ATPase